MTNTVTVPARPSLDRITKRLTPVFGTVLLLPELAWCIQCQMFMEAWPGIPTGIVYQCRAPEVRHEHVVDAFDADYSAKAFYLASPARQPLPPNRSSASAWRDMFFGFIARVDIDTTPAATHLVTGMHRYV